MVKKTALGSPKPEQVKVRLISDKRIKSLVKNVTNLLTKEASIQNRIKSVEDKKATIETEAGTFMHASLALNRSKFTALSLDLKKLQAKIVAKKSTLTTYVETNNRINGLRLGSATQGE